jgi:hypothetical protein
MNKLFRSAIVAFAFLLSADALAVGVGVGVTGGVANGGRGESPETLHNYDRLERDVRSIRIAQRHLEKLSRQDVPDKLDEAAQAEWGNQSKWLEKQADRLDDLVNDMGRLLDERRLGRNKFEQFDYHQVQAQTGFVLDGMRDKAENYAVKGKAAAKRQAKAIKIIARAD